MHNTKSSLTVCYEWTWHRRYCAFQRRDHTANSLRRIQGKVWMVDHRKSRTSPSSISISKSISALPTKACLRKAHRHTREPQLTNLRRNSAIKGPSLSVMSLTLACTLSGMRLLPHLLQTHDRLYLVASQHLTEGVGLYKRSMFVLFVLRKT